MLTCNELVTKFVCNMVEILFCNISGDFLTFKKGFIYLFSERGEGGRKRETLIGCLLHALPPRPLQQGPGIEPVTFQFEG